MRDTLALDHRFFQDPYPTYAALRDAGGVREALLPTGHRIWIIARYADARGVLTDSRLSKRLNAIAPRRDPRAPAGRRDSSDFVIDHMLNCDPPDHTRLRRLVSRAFTTQRTESTRPLVERLTNDALDRLSGRAHMVDLVKEYSFPLTTMLLTELLGVPESDRTSFAEWATLMVDSPGATAPDRTPADTRPMIGYLARLAADKRANPGDDLLSVLAHATSGADRLTDYELVLTALLLLVAGHDTTVGLIGNGVLALLRDPTQRGALQADPRLMPGAVEELLRRAGPVSFTTLRYTTTTVDIGPVAIPEGELVVVALDSANHDPRRFPDPARLDVTRRASGHLAFGHGAHYCVGAPMARLVGEVAIGHLLRRFPRLRLAAATELTWLASGLLRGLERLPVFLDG